MDYLNIVKERVPQNTDFKTIINEFMSKSATEKGRICLFLQLKNNIVSSNALSLILSNQHWMQIQE